MKQNVKIAKELLKLAKSLVSQKKIKFDDTMPISDIVKNFIININDYVQDKYTDEQINYALNHINDFMGEFEGSQILFHQLDDYIKEKITPMIKKYSLNVQDHLICSDNINRCFVLFEWYVTVDNKICIEFCQFNTKKTFNTINEFVNNFDNIVKSAFNKYQINGFCEMSNPYIVKVEFHSTYSKINYLKKFIDEIKGMDCIKNVVIDKASSEKFITYLLIRPYKNVGFLSSNDIEIACIEGVEAACYRLNFSFDYKH